MDIKVNHKNSFIPGSDTVLFSESLDPAISLRTAITFGAVSYTHLFKLHFLPYHLLPEIDGYKQEVGCSCYNLGIFFLQHPAELQYLDVSLPFLQQFIISVLGKTQQIY